MASNTITVDGRDLMARINFTVRMPRGHGLRIWLACKLLALAGWVSGVGMAVEMDGEDDAASEA